MQGSGLGRVAGARDRDRFVRIERRRARRVSAGGDEDRQACQSVRVAGPEATPITPRCRKQTPPPRVSPRGSPRDAHLVALEIGDAISARRPSAPPGRVAARGACLVARRRRQTCRLNPRSIDPGPVVRRDQRVGRLSHQSPGQPGSRRRGLRRDGDEEKRPHRRPATLAVPSASASPAAATVADATATSAVSTAPAITSRLKIFMPTLPPVAGDLPQGRGLVEERSRDRGPRSGRKRSRNRRHSRSSTRDGSDRSGPGSGHSGSGPALGLRLRDARRRRATWQSRAARPKA